MKTQIIFIFLLNFILVAFQQLEAQEKNNSVIRDDSKVYNFDLSFDVGNLEISADKGKNYVLMIAVESYNDVNIPDLKEPVSDAEKLIKMLNTYYSFETSLTFFLKNPTLSDIGLKLQELSNKINGDDNLLLFYAGHGEWDANAEAGFWLPSDARKNDKSTWLANSSLRDFIRSIKAKHILLISDACFSGSLFRGEQGLINAAIGIQQLNALPSRKAMTSGALKSVPDKSVFLEYLIRRLGQNPSKYLPAERLFYSLKQYVMSLSPGQVPQYGDIRDAGENQGGDFIFIRK